MKLGICAVALQAGLLFLCAAAGAADDAAKKLNALFPDVVVAKGKGIEVTRTQVEEAFTALKASASSQGQRIPENQRAAIESNLVDRIVLTKLLVERATPEELRLARAKTESNIAQLRTNAPSQEIFDNQIKASGMSLDQLRSRMSEQLACESVLERELKPKVTLTDADYRKFYDENPSKFEQPEMVRASHILIGTLDPATQQPLPADKKKEKEDLIKQLRTRALAGEDRKAVGASILSRAARWCRSLNLRPFHSGRARSVTWLRPNTASTLSN
jgi:peptidyl-prolyl cis-trans isomerase C